jgi:hypothetical protein
LTTGSAQFTVRVSSRTKERTVVKVARFAAVGLLALPALGASNASATIPQVQIVPQLCGLGLGVRSVATAWQDSSGFKASGIVRTFPSVAIAKRSMANNAARIKGCRGASMVAVPAKFARIGDDRFIVRVINGELMFVRHGRAVAIVSQFKPLSIAKLATLGRFARSAALKFGP